MKDHFIYNIRIEDIRDTHFSHSDLMEYFLIVNDNFNPTLLERITDKSNVIDLDNYLFKILKLGETRLAIIEDKIVGIIVFYSNDLISKTAYIPLLTVIKNFQGMGISTKLLSSSIEFIKNRGMKTIRVNTWEDNFAALALYTKFGFEVISQMNKDILLKLDITK